MISVSLLRTWSSNATCALAHAGSTPWTRATLFEPFALFAALESHWKLIGAFTTEYMSRGLSFMNPGRRMISGIEMMWSGSVHGLVGSFGLGTMVCLRPDGSGAPIFGRGDP